MSLNKQSQTTQDATIVGEYIDPQVNLRDHYEHPTMARPHLPKIYLYIIKRCFYV